MTSKHKSLNNLVANFTDLDAQGPNAYADQHLVDHPEYNRNTAKADAIAAVSEFCDALVEWND